MPLLSSICAIWRTTTCVCRANCRVAELDLDARDEMIHVRAARWITIWKSQQLDDAAAGAGQLAA